MRRGKKGKRKGREGKGNANKEEKDEKRKKEKEGRKERIVFKCSEERFILMKKIGENLTIGGKKK